MGPWIHVFLENAPDPAVCICPTLVALTAHLQSAYCVLGTFMCIVSFSPHNKPVSG